MSTEIPTEPPPGYTPLKPGIRCKCIYSIRIGDTYYCCNGTGRSYRAEQAEQPEAPVLSLTPMTDEMEADLLAKLMAALDAVRRAGVLVARIVPLDAHYERVTDLLLANNREVLRRRAAETSLVQLCRALEPILKQVDCGQHVFVSEEFDPVRDVHGAQFHPLQAKRQHRFAGRAALGLDPVG